MDYSETPLLTFRNASDCNWETQSLPPFVNVINFLKTFKLAFNKGFLIVVTLLQKRHLQLHYYNYYHFIKIEHGDVTDNPSAPQKSKQPNKQTNTQILSVILNWWMANIEQNRIIF